MVTVKSQNTYPVSIPPHPTGVELHRAIAEIDGTQDRVHVMAASLTFVTPRELCGLRALLDVAARHVDVVHFDCPNALDVHRHLERMHLYRDLPDNVVLSSPRPKTRAKERRTNLIELCRIDCNDDVGQLPSRVWRVAHDQLGNPAIAKACATAFESAIENVIDHAQSPIGALVAAQRYQKVGLDLAVVDIGVGIPTTLRRKAEYQSLSDLDAVQKALEDKVTCTKEEFRGAGLMDLVAKVKNAGSSTLVVQSGRAHVALGANDADVQLLIPALAVPGTWISLRLKP
jgi:hypothetical protein